MELEATVKLPVGLCLVVAGIESAYAVEVRASAFSKFFGEGKCNGEPVVVALCDVCIGGFDALGDKLNIVCRVRWCSGDFGGFGDIGGSLSRSLVLLSDVSLVSTPSSIE